MALAAKLTLGQLASTAETDAYTVPSGKQAVVKLLSLVNNHTGDVTVQVYVKRSTTKVRLWPKDRAIAAKERDKEDLALAMEAGDKIVLQADVANVIDYIISGAEG